MAFVVHWPNTYGERYKGQTVQGLLTSRVCPLNASLSLQSDILFPNAINSFSTGTPSGCIGNQLDIPFPLESRTPFALPLLMYSRPKGTSVSTITDMAAAPVLNWENWIKNLRVAGAAVQKLKLNVKTDETEHQKKQGGLPAKPKNIEARATKRRIKKLLAGFPVEVESGEVEPIEKNQTDQKKLNSSATNQLPKKIVLKKPKRMSIAERLRWVPFESYGSIPSLRLQSTWNYLYNGSGASAFTRRKGVRELYVGNGSKLRKISLMMPKSKKLLSYVVKSVWEEDEVPSNVDSTRATESDALSDTIYEIKARKCDVAVRRGKSIEIYNRDPLPSLIASIPNVSHCYGSKNKKLHKYSPLLTSFDVNNQVPAQIATIDDNGIIQFIDIIKGRTISYFDVKLSSPPRPDDELPGRDKTLSLEEPCLISYVADHPQVIFYSAESTLHLYDKRNDPLSAGPEVIFNLRSSISSLSFSDQEDFTSFKEKILSERISCLTPSKRNPVHVYVGTSERVLLFDIRVPNNPVTKLTHGLASPPSLIQTLAGDNFEIVFCGTGRNSEVFCAAFDCAHLSCLEREGCEELNPILHSFPRHLSNGREFFDEVQNQGLCPPWEKDFEWAKAHCNGWTTGISVVQESLGDPRRPPPCLLLTNNSWGDVFLQEWEQRPISASRQADSSHPLLNSFLENWKSSMETPLAEETPHPRISFSAKDNSTLMDAASENPPLRIKDYDPFTPHKLTYHRVKGGLPTLEQQIQEVQSENPSSRLQNFLEVWSGVEGINDEVDLNESGASDSGDEMKEEANSPPEYSSDGSDLLLQDTIPTATSLVTEISSPVLPQGEDEEDDDDFPI